MLKKTIRRVDTRNMSREEWLAQRRHSIGGSDAAAIIGLNHWASPYTVWADKTGRLPDKPDTEAMRIGRDLEEYVARRWCEDTGKEVRRCNAILYNDDYPFAHADVDRLVVGEDAGFECKTTSTLDVKQFGNTDFPEQYYAQCVHYLAVTGLQKWYLAVLVFGRGFFTFALDRDDAEIGALMAAERAFWMKVQTDTPPTPDGSKPTGDALKTIYAESAADGQRELFGREPFGREPMLGEYMSLKRQQAALDERISKEDGITTMDNGVTQQVEARSGISLKVKETIKPRVKLIPFRTFTEIGQPESEFLTRVDDNGNIGFFEADGGAWKIAAKQNIADYLKRELTDLVDTGLVVVMI